VVNKQEIIHEEKNEDNSLSSDESSSDDEDVNGVFGHKLALRHKASSKVSDTITNNKSNNDLKVNVNGPVRLGSNMIYERAPQSAAQPNIKGLGYINQNMAYRAYPSNQGYPQPYAIPNTAAPMYYGGPGVSLEALNQQLIQQNKLSYYSNINPLYPSQQPQSAGLSRRPPGFEFMAPKPAPYNPSVHESMMAPHNQSVHYAEYQPPLLQPQTPYYAKHSASPLVPPSSGYDISMGKQQPQSAMMPNYSNSDLKSKVAKPTVSNSDSLEGKVFEIVKKCETILEFDSKIEYLEGKLCDMLFTQTGSRFIQKQMNEQIAETIDPDDHEAKQRKQDRIESFTSFIL
jgi:hypothetical protein